MAVIVANSKLPPAEEKNGKVSPVTGISPMTPPMLITAWTTNQLTTPPATNLLNRSGAARATCIPQ